MLGLCTLAALPPARAAFVPGDVNGDGEVSIADLRDLVVEIFDGDGDDVAGVAGGDFVGGPGADANQDGSITAADFALTVWVQPGLTPALPTTSATHQPSPTPTVTSTPNLTQPTASATATACISEGIPPLRVGSPEVIGGALVAGDCSNHGTGGRPGDVFAVSAAPGQAVTIAVTATDFTPRVIIHDANGYFGRPWLRPPLEFLVTTSRPYEFVVTSQAPGAMTGAYTVTVSVRNCPSARNLTSGGRVSATLKDTDCPDPASPSTPAHRYTFSAAAGSAVEFRMTTSPANEDVPDPFLTIYGPKPTEDAFTGIEIAEDEESGGEVENGTTDALLSFYAVQSGTYTVVATGGSGPYNVSFSTRTCTAVPVSVSDQPRTVSGTLTGASCPAPFPLVRAEKGEFNTRAEMWSLTADAGDVLAFNMNSLDFDAQLYLLEPGQRVVAADDDSSEDSGSDAQLAFTAPQAGTYTVIAASNDAYITQDDSTGSYSLTAQKCPATPLSLDTLTAGSLALSDCHGQGGALIKSYKLDCRPELGCGPNQFVTATMAAAADSFIDPALQLIEPSGHRLANNDDPFLLGTSLNARVSRVLPEAGTYFLTASSFQDWSEGGFAVRVQRCRTAAAAAGTVTGEFRDDDCELAGDGEDPGPKFNVFTIPTNTNQLLSLVPPEDACALVASPDGLQGPGPECSSEFLAMPLAQAGTTALMIAAPDSGFRGQYTFAVQTCPASGVLSFASSAVGFVTGTECRDASTAPADFYLIRAPRELTMFSEGLSANLTRSFNGGSVVVDATGVYGVANKITENSEEMFAFGADLGIGLAVRPADPAATGSYTIAVDPANFSR